MYIMLNKTSTWNHSFPTGRMFPSAMGEIINLLTSPNKLIPITSSLIPKQNVEWRWSFFLILFFFSFLFVIENLHMELFHKNLHDCVTKPIVILLQSKEQLHTI